MHLDNVKNPNVLEPGLKLDQCQSCFMKASDSLLESEDMIKIEAFQNLEQYSCAHMLWSWGRIMGKEKVLQILLVLENIYNCIKTKA